MSWELADPTALWLLVLPLQLAAWLFWRRGSLRPSLRLPSLDAAEGMPVGWRVRTRPIVTIGRLLVLTLLLDFGIFFVWNTLSPVYLDVPTV